jgi:hypothetical protein
LNSLTGNVSAYDNGDEHAGELRGDESQHTARSDAGERIG